MAPMTRLALALSLCALVAGCGYNQVFSSWFDHTAGPNAGTGPKMEGHAYMLRGLAGDIYSLGMDQLADLVTRRGVTATVHGMTEYNSLADDIIRKYRAGEERGPIILVGHSTGGDLIIAMAQKLKAADIPVALAFGLDPTRISPNVPSNVELFINIYQTYNPIGGGEESPASGFRGRLINVDLHEHTEIVHITLDKSPVLHDLVAQKILAVAAFAARQEAAPARKKLPTALPNEIRPLALKYVVPRDAPIVLWDSAVKVTVKPGDTLQSIVARYETPSWAIAQLNRLSEDAPLAPGRTLIVPRSFYTDTSPPPPPAAAATSMATPPAHNPAARVSQSAPAAPADRAMPVPAAQHADQRPPNSFSDRWGGATTK
jgi:LysM repeat protein